MSGDELKPLKSEDIPKKVTCSACKRDDIGVNREGFMRRHNRKHGGMCDGSGRHIRWNNPQSK